MNIEIYEKIKGILVEKLSVSPDEISPESELVNDLGINSLELADLVLDCEDAFDIEIDDKSISTFTTIADVVEYLDNITK